ncbi:hypothetical protein BO70DRAFT_294293 [Aspergillus heteromorphus CBS 117.55]|uniref:Uncharacterized protein n=1 Tax=Aspergillus heteromorphus CBS 117.55 TaxID=1448321 RepID=A0A317VX14_9EURO|nr:uncharacterized protein BO70DRAFT_294293 [Aspergillus heteromorphus CBS 117.55]PWY78315.1 hypothetical protein BO70DRAFT_294293 [Aspergillus heteromorphus CBS 117.55]
MHRHAQQSVEPTSLARLSLAKFSHSTTSFNHRGPLNWCHVMGNGDLTGIFERLPMTSFTPDRILLKVLRVHESLEEIDLTHLVIEAGNMNQSSQNPSFRSIFAVVVKLPCLAVKYPRGNAVRRFQIKFSLDRDFYTALAILSDMKCPFSEASVGSVRPLTSSHWNSGSIEPTSMVKEAQNGPNIPASSSSTGSIYPPYPSTTSISGPSSVTTGKYLICQHHTAI